MTLLRDRWIEVYITEMVTLSPNIQNGRFDQFNFINQSLNKVM